MASSEHVAVLGASPNEDRYSHKAQKMLMEYGHTVYPVTPKEGPILGVRTYPTVTDIEPELDTVTIYLSPKHLPGVLDHIIAKQPKRAIFNPGTEDPASEQTLTAAGIHCQHACTLVLLRSSQFTSSGLD